MKNVSRRVSRAGLVALLLVSLVGCGTILYPERSGQGRGRLDATVVLLDGAGCFLFLVPGLIAFAVDFATGAIYLPHGARSDLDEVLGDEIGAHPSSAELAEIVAFVERETGIPIDARALEVVRAREGEDVALHLRELNAGIAAVRSHIPRAGG